MPQIVENLLPIPRYLIKELLLDLLDLGYKVIAESGFMCLWYDLDLHEFLTVMTHSPARVPVLKRYSRKTVTLSVANSKTSTWTTVQTVSIGTSTR